ncbi:MAG: DNA translocase FtsK [Bacteroidales bacterium]|jgi:S-DNA-T family DNA segregation ATPase FtsK/SpoIIIE
MSTTKNQLPKNVLKNAVVKETDSDENLKKGKQAKTDGKKSRRKTKKAEKSDDKHVKKNELKKFNPTALEKFSQVVGVISIVIAIYLTVICISFLVNWFSNSNDIVGANQSVQSVLTEPIEHAEGAEAEFKANLDTGTKNVGGSLGAYLSNFFIKSGFGIGFFFIILWLYSVGLQFAFKNKLMPFFGGFAVSTLLMAWLSLLMAYIFVNTKYSILGGIVGFEMYQYLYYLTGNIGVVLLLTVVFVLFLIIIYNFSLVTFKNKLSKVKDKVVDTTQSLVGSANFKKTQNQETNTEEQSGDDENAEGEDDNVFIKNEFATNTAETAEQTEDEVPENTFFKDSDDDDITWDVTQKPKQEVKKSDGIDFIIEDTTGKSANTVQPDEDVDDELEEENRIGSINTPYDPRLDLSDYKFPTPDLLKDYGSGIAQVSQEELEANKDRIVETLGNYGIAIDKIRATIGPTVTLYEIVPAPGVRIAKIRNLEDDIALSLAALGIRIIAPVPGKGTVGIEVPNQKPEIVGLKTVVSSEAFINSKFQLPIAFGKTISNEDFIVDLAKMPHILMAGATGQGKSVGLNVIIASLLFHKHPAELKFVLVDPKKVELPLFTKIERHYLAKLPDSEEAIITDTTKVVHTLKSLNIEMDARYDLLRDAQVKDIKQYNAKFISRRLNPNDGHRFLPYIVVVIDEFADLILTAGKEVEMPITRLAQLARAVGIHLVIATQRPSVNIITGIIKANFPARIAFRVISKVDSRTILDSAGADQLIGRGDMLFSQGGDMKRIQCAFIDTPEIEELTDFIGSQRGYPYAMALPEYVDENGNAAGMSSENIDDRDELFEEAARLIVTTQQGSASLLQRRLKLGYNRAGRIIDQLEAAGIVGPYESGKTREVKVANEFALEQFLKDLDSK